MQLVVQRVTMLDPIEHETAVSIEPMLIQAPVKAKSTIRVDSVLISAAESEESFARAG